MNLCFVFQMERLTGLLLENKSTLSDQLDLRNQQHPAINYVHALLTNDNQLCLKIQSNFFQINDNNSFTQTIYSIFLKNKLFKTTTIRVYRLKNIIWNWNILLVYMNILFSRFLFSCDAIYFIQMLKHILLKMTVVIIS